MTLSTMLGIDIPDWSIWLMLLAIFLVIEIATLGLTTIWFAGGSLVACIVSLCGGNLIFQIVAFIIVSVILLFFTRPIAVKYFNRGRVKTNADSLIGQTGVTKEKIDNLNGHGTVQINGQEWTARSTDDSILIEANKNVEIIQIKGVKLIVKEK